MKLNEQIESLASELLDNPPTRKMLSGMRRKYFIRLASLYILPLCLLIVFFFYEYNDLMTESRELHLLSVAESKSRIMDIYLIERLNNIFNTIENPELKYPIDSAALIKMLANLKKHSDAFIDIGYFENSSIQTGYAGPLKFLTNKDYKNEFWLKQLMSSKIDFFISDIYLGMRKAPHFTIAVKKNIGGIFYIFKVSLDPNKIYNYMTSNEKSSDVKILIITKDGKYQLAPAEVSEPMQLSPFLPAKEPIIGIDEFTIDNKSGNYAYSWLTGVEWAVITIEKEESAQSFNSLKIGLFFTSIGILSILVLIILIRSKKIVEIEKERLIVRLQLEQASKLATVGELASGIAHEIGNPLNIIANEVGIMQDYANPLFNINKTIFDLEPHFKKINNAISRIKDINKKLLTFVRKTENQLYDCNINELIEDLLSGFFERELKLENIDIIKKFDKNMPLILTDGNQLRQVIVNMLNNSRDAIKSSGRIVIETSFDQKNIFISIQDNGEGIPGDKLARIFLPFFTTKPVGKGTGLGLSVSYNIIKSLGGDIQVQSILGSGTTFTVILPIEKASD